MAGDFLLDTNTVILLLKNDRSISLRTADATNVFLSSVVLGELYFGALNSRRSVQNLKHLEDFSRSFVVLPCDSNTAKIYGGIKASLKATGRPIPENDIWIAAIAIEHDLTLATRDAHFTFVPNLKTERW